MAVARRTDRLQSLAEQIHEQSGSEVLLIVTQDLTEPGAVQNVMRIVAEQEWHVDVLVNNVGVANYGWFGDIELDRELAMIDLNCKVSVQLTHGVLQHMKSSGRGGIINVGGLLDEVKAGTFSTYCATKAFVTTFSQCLNEELQGTGIDVVCISPGYNPDTEIFASAGIQGSFPFPRGNPSSVAKHGIALLKRRRAVAVDGLLNKMLAFILKFTPIRVRQSINRVLIGTPEKHGAAPS